MKSKWKLCRVFLFPDLGPKVYSEKSLSPGSFIIQTNPLDAEHPEHPGDTSYEDSVKLGAFFLFQDISPIRMRFVVPFSVSKRTNPGSPSFPMISPGLRKRVWFITSFE